MKQSYFPDIFSLLSCIQSAFYRLALFTSKTNTKLAILTIICAVGPRRLGPRILGLRRLKEAMEWLFEAYL
jgi:hypothetical protein